MRTLLTIALLALPVTALAQSDAELADRKQTAVNRGVEWLIQQQQADGTWTYDDKPMMVQGAYPMTPGITALCAMSLLKCGIGPDEEPVKKAFAYLFKNPPQFTYSVGCVLVALEAYANFDEDAAAKKAGAARGAGSGSETTVRKKKKKRRGKKGKKRVDPRVTKLAQTCVDWLVAHQRSGGLWRYGMADDEDLSTVQYAMLGLNAAESVGATVPLEVYERVAERLIECQADGTEEVRPFPVPAADTTFQALRKVETQLEKEILKVERRFKNKETDKKGLTKSDHMATAERKATGKLLETMEKGGAMVARGWAYFPPGTDNKGQAWKSEVTGSVTTSALASLFICKARLERKSRLYEKKLKPKLNRALRDGTAWVAKNYTVSQNPGHQLHHYYYMYGLERAGILGLVQRFGTHDWYSDGTAMFLAQQKRDGSWKAQRTTSGAVPDTCFALLFLARGTTPVVRIPGRVMTGQGSD